MIDVVFEDIDTFDINPQVSFLPYLINAEQCHLGEVNLIFCNDDYILRVNQDFLKHDYYTDIITFNYNVQNTLFADIFISVDTVLSNSEMYNVSFTHELTRVIFHGFLHLVGYDDKTDEDVKRMREKEDEYLSLFHVKHPDILI
jgi:probable rRNA maturation factor